MPKFSPQSQAVLDAYGDFEAANTDAMAAALRVVADWVTPKCSTATTADYSAGATNERIVVRAQLLSIAAELGATND